jgi:hypothetical protein
LAGMACGTRTCRPEARCVAEGYQLFRLTQSEPPNASRYLIADI